MAAYDQWKERQPPQELPDPQAQTEEKIAYLKDHYSGELSWVERVDMLNTTMDMGLITREERNLAYGDDTVVLTPDMTPAEIEAAGAARLKKDPWNQDWNVYFSEDPVSGFKTADDVLTWRDRVLSGEAEDGSSSVTPRSTAASRSTEPSGLPASLNSWESLVNLTVSKFKASGDLFSWLDEVLSKDRNNARPAEAPQKADIPVEGVPQA